MSEPALLTVLVERMARSEPEALAELYDATAADVNALLLRMLGCSEDSEEILVDVYMRAWKKAATFSPDRGSVMAWLVTMARSMAIDRMRHRKIQCDAPNFEPEELARLAPAGSSSETLTDDTRRRKQVAAFLRELPAEQREVLELAFFCGFTHSELAIRLEQPLGTIKSQIRMTLGRLHSLLEQGMTV